MLDLYNYFEHEDGFGVLSTADEDGVVNSALFARPRIEEGRAIFLTVDKKNLSNLRKNKSGYYLFKSNKDGYEGVRLKLQLFSIYQDDAKVQRLSRKPLKDGIERYILEFDILEVLPLCGV